MDLQLSFKIFTPTFASLRVYCIYMDLNKPRIINKYAYKTGNPKSNNDILYDTQSHPEKITCISRNTKTSIPSVSEPQVSASGSMARLRGPAGAP